MYHKNVKTDLESAIVSVVNRNYTRSGFCDNELDDFDTLCAASDERLFNTILNRRDQPRGYEQSTVRKVQVP